MEKKEKKVEYLELIYDLIFVYLIGRNNSLLHTLHNGFLDSGLFVTYVICTLAVIQIWSYSTFYINRYGRNGIRDHIFLFINMYLLYHMAEGTRAGWEGYFNRYNLSWALILFNIGLQHVIERKNHKAAPWELIQLDRSAAVLWIEALIVAVSIPVHHFTGFTMLAVPAILVGIFGTIFSGQINVLVPVDFEHLTERVMLYIVFTFGEMIIGISAYFEAGISANTIYFSLMAFLVVAGLFLCYEILYDHVIDREKVTSGTGYMMIHVFVIFSLNNITTALELMQEEEAELFPKILFLTGSFLLYFILLFLLEMYAKKSCRPDRKFILSLAGSLFGFVIMMLLFRRFMYVNILISVVYIFGVVFLLYYRSIQRKSNLKNRSEKQ